MKEVKDITAMVVDHGLFFGLAQVLSKSYKRVLYHFPGWERGFSTARDGTIGDGFAQVEHCFDLWDHKDEVDLFIFPDNGHGPLQLELESQRKLVWGSRLASNIEVLRGQFLGILQEVGLEIPPYESIQGLSNLRAYLKRHKERYVKISRWRADMETWHHINYELSGPKLDELAVKFGPLQECLNFLVFEPIDTQIEVGYDGYCIDGWFPNTAVHGIEKKDQAYIGAIQDYDDLPEQVREVNEKMSQVLKKFRYRNFWSSEIRIMGDRFYFIDPTCRAGMPSGDSQFILYDNLADIILHGANGEVIEPEYSSRFAAQALIKHNDDPEQWRTIQVPEEVSEFVHLVSPVKVEDTFAISPSASTGEIVGSVLAKANTIEEAIGQIHEHADQLKNNPITIHTEALMDVLGEMLSAREEGVEMTQEEIPEPEIVLQYER